MYKYGMNNRAVDIGTVPQHFTHTENSDEFTYGVVCYDEPLSKEDINNYELVDLSYEHLEDTADFIADDLKIHCEKLLKEESDKHLTGFIKIQISKSYSSRIAYSDFEKLKSLVKKKLKEYLA